MLIIGKETDKCKSSLQNKFKWFHEVERNKVLLKKPCQYFKLVFLECNHGMRRITAHSERRSGYILSTGIICDLDCLISSANFCEKAERQLKSPKNDRTFFLLTMFNLVREMALGTRLYYVITLPRRKC